MRDLARLLIEIIKLKPSIRNLIQPLNLPFLFNLISKDARYIKLHRKNHITVVTSRKMRDLAKLLIEIIKLKPIRNLIQPLNPENFYLLSSATEFT